MPILSCMSRSNYLNLTNSPKYWIYNRKEAHICNYVMSVLSHGKQLLNNDCYVEICNNYFCLS